MTPWRIDIQWIEWGARTMRMRGGNECLHRTSTHVIAYAQVAATQLVDDTLRIYTGNATFDMRFESASNARDCAAELARRMDAACNCIAR